MRIEDLWAQLEADQGRGASGFAGWITRLSRSEPGCRLSVGIEASSGRRGLLLRVPRNLIPPRRRWPSFRGIEVFARRLTDNATDDATLGVVLKERRFSDVFTALAEDLARRVTEVGPAIKQVKALMGQLARWQKFLAAAAEGMSVEQQRGLYGELHVLRDHLLPVLGPGSAVEGWSGPRGAHQDFQFATGALEVKSTMAKQPQSVRIANERQLDCSGIAALFLHVVVIDEREVDPVQGVPGEILPAIVADLRKRLTGDLEVLERFNDRLLDAGYLDAHAPRYEDRRFGLRGEMTYRIGREFPCITERDLPEGVGDATYTLSLAACRAFAVITSDMVNTLAFTQTGIRTEKRKPHART